MPKSTENKLMDMLAERLSVLKNSVTPEIKRRTAGRLDLDPRTVQKYLDGNAHSLSIGTSICNALTREIEKAKKELA